VKVYRKPFFIEHQKHVKPNKFRWKVKIVTLTGCNKKRKCLFQKCFEQIDEGPFLRNETNSMKKM
jgi:hypothetical protein